MSQYYQTTQGTTQYQLANIIAQSSSQTITGYYNIQYIPATDPIETKVTSNGYNINGADISNISSVYYKDVTSTETLTVSSYNKCMIVACSGGGGGGGGGGAGYRYDPPNSNTKQGGDGGDGGKGIAAVYKNIDITSYPTITVTFDTANNGTGGDGGNSTNAKDKSGSGNDGNDGNSGTSTTIVGKASSGISTILLKCPGGNRGHAGNGGNGNNNGGNGSNGGVSSVYTILNNTNQASDVTTFSSLQVQGGNTILASGTTYGQSGNGGAGDTNKGGSAGDGNSGSGPFARIYFYK